MKKRFSHLIIFVLALCMIFSTVAAITLFADDNATEGDGRTFTGSEELSMTVPLDVQPMTYKARINVPAEASKKGVILGNYHDTSVAALDFQINGSGNPSLYFVGSSKAETTVTFDYDVRGKGWIDLAITHTETETGSEFTCYINGEAIGTVTVEKSLKISFVSCQRIYRLMLGRDWASASYNFKGAIQNVAIYDRPLTADEISASVDLADTSLMAYYDLNKAENQTGWRVTDSTANSHDFEPLFQETRRDFEYDYSLAVVGDTQHLVYDDAHLGTQWMSAIYDWIVANKDSKNIKFVMGVGDITHRDGKDDVSDGIDKTNVEWDISVNELNKLYDAGIPYSLIIGNHDSTKQLDKYFANNPNFTEADIGYYDGNSLGNYYMKFNAGTDKYIVFGLDYGANDDKLAWAGNIIANNPEYKVIITTHAYMSANGTTLEAHESSSVPRPSEDASATQKTLNNGDDVWHELASRYENVVLVFSGHISASDIIYRKDYGDHGNTVYQMLMDFQAMDAKYSRETGMVAMLYFTNDGNVVHVEYVSAYKSLAAQKADPNAKDIVYRPAVNSFSIEYPTEKGVGEETKYGTISPTYVDKEIYPVVLFKEDGTFVGGFYNLNRAMESIVSVYNDKNGSYIMLMRGDTVDDSYVDTVNSGKFNGKLIIDLDGHSVTNKRVNYLMNFTYSATVVNNPSITIKNGTFIKDGNSLGLIKFDYGSTLTADIFCDITFENVTFRSLVNYNKNTSVVFVTYEGGYGTATGTVNVNAVFNDCTYDFVGSIDKAVMIPMRHYYYTEKDQVVFNTTINGGSAIAASASEFTGYLTLVNNNTNGRADTLKYGRGTDGKYISIVLPTGKTAPTSEYKLANGGTGKFQQASTDETTVTYTMYNATGGVPTKYAVIPETYEDAELYPVALFEKKTDGYTFIGAYSDFSAATTAMGKQTNWDKAAKTYVIFFRNDATAPSSSFNMQNAFGTYIIDLNGHTLTQKGKYLFRINRTVAGTSYSKRYTMTFLNGTIINKSGYVMLSINYGEGSTSHVNNQSYSVTHNFDNVTFKTNQPLFGNWETGASYLEKDNPMKIDVYVLFNNCTFDYTGVGSGFAMVDMTDVDGNDRTIYNVTINGGKIIADKTFTKARFLAMDGNTNGRADKVTFGKYDGKYITLKVPEGVSVSADEYEITEDYKAVFGKVGDTYTLVPNEFKILGAYLNIQENINVCYAVGLPAGYTNPYMVFEFNGNKYTVNEYTVDATGKLVFKFVGVVPQMLGENIKATLYATNGAGVEESFEVAEYSVKTYCVNMIAKEPENIKLVTLLSDLLVYGAKAQLYNNPNLAESELVTYGVEGLAPTAEFVAPTKSDKTLVGEADASVSWKGVALRYENAMAMKFSFVASADYTLKISINGRTVEYKVSDLAKDGDNYVVYFRGIEATEYAMVVTATFYNADGVQVGQSAQYSVNSYVFSKYTGNDTLADLVKATYNYGVSAENYVK